MDDGRGRRGRAADQAREQHGLATRAQVLATGMSASSTTRDVAGGRLERVHANVLRFPGAPRTWEQRLLAAVLTGGDGAAASHRSAALLWELVEANDEPVEVTVRRGRLPRPDGVVLHRSRDLAARWCTIRRRIPVTNPLRTLVDLGAVEPRHVVADAVELALVRRLVTVPALEWARAAHAKPGRDGVGVLRHVLDARALGAIPADSVLEARMATLLQRHDLPRPAFQHEVRIGARLLARVDFAYPELLLAIEVDGLESHGDRELQRDLERQNALVGQAWTVLRFTWTDVVRRPARVAREVRAVRARLRPALGA